MTAIPRGAEERDAGDGTPHIRELDWLMLVLTYQSLVQLVFGKN